MYFTTLVSMLAIMQGLRLSNYSLFKWANCSVFLNYVVLYVVQYASHYVCRFLLGLVKPLGVV